MVLIMSECSVDLHTPVSMILEERNEDTAPLYTSQVLITCMHSVVGEFAYNLQVSTFFAH